MSKQPLKFSLHPAAVAMLERLLQNHDRSKLTHAQIAHIAPLKEAVRIARTKLNLMARADIIFEGRSIILYTHPDRREEGRVMVYDKREEDLLIETPFVGRPDEGYVLAWMEGLPR